jgi:phosphatidate cytidylyltransferase
MHEYYAAARLQGRHPVALAGYLGVAALLAVTEYAPEGYRDPLVVCVLFLAVMAAMMGVFGRGQYTGALADIATTVFGLAYVGLGMSFYLRLRNFDVAAAQGYPDVFLTGHISTLLMVILPVWLLDSTAFTVGGLWGRRLLAPILSPHKTVEGAAAGFAAGVLATVLMGVYWNHMVLGQALALGLMIGVLAQCGDLAKSVFKRDVGIKDFGTVFGAHGGVLDRFDGVLFVMPVAYFYLWLILPHLPK